MTIPNQINILYTLIVIIYMDKACVSFSENEIPS